MTNIHIRKKTRKKLPNPNEHTKTWSNAHTWYENDKTWTNKYEL